jgi:hypothetical protein
MVLFNEARLRANERLYQPGGKGYLACKDRFEAMIQQEQLVESSNSGNEEGAKDEAPASKLRKRPCEDYQEDDDR